MALKMVNKNVGNDDLEQSSGTAMSTKKDWKWLMDQISILGIVRNIPFMLFLVLLGIIYIAANQSSMETQRELEKQQKVLTELGWKYMDIKTKLMNAGMESKVIQNGAVIGLKPLTLPAYKIPADDTIQQNQQ